MDAMIFDRLISQLDKGERPLDICPIRHARCQSGYAHVCDVPGQMSELCHTAVRRENTTTTAID